jgi:hypothetical protein
MLALKHHNLQELNSDINLFNINHYNYPNAYTIRHSIRINFEFIFPALCPRTVTKIPRFSVYYCYLPNATVFR